MKRKVLTLIKKPAVISTIAFFVIFTVVAIIAIGGNNSSGTVGEESVVEQVNLRHGYGLYIDGTFIAATSIEAVINDTLDTVLDSRLSEFNGSTVTSGAYTNLITVTEGEYSAESFVTAADLVALLGIESENSYTTTVCDYTGEKVNVSLNVRATVQNVTTSVLESNIVYVDNANLLATHEDVVINEGHDGVTEEIYESVFINGECVSKRFLSSTVVVEAVDRVIERGVLDNERLSASNGGTSVDDSPFIMPYDGGYISSYYGWRSMGWHSGIDIIGGAGVSCYGDPFWAARDGIVTFAGSFDTYGLLIIIEHEDGSETRYAHCSAIKVEEGEYVEQGQIIGNIGDTGYVTGPHIHFEIRIDGQTVNPLKYVRLYQ